MREMFDAMRDGVCDNPQIGELMLTLADRLSKTGGKKVYGYFKADVKAIADAITDELATDPRVAACYAAWYEMRNQVLQTYADKLPDPLPLSQQKEFKQIKNMIIQEALRLNGQNMKPPARSAPVAGASVYNAPNTAQADVATDAASTAVRLLRGLARLFEDQQRQQTAHADHIDRKRARELRDKRQAQGHARDEQTQSQIY
jgi:hypothetical protein